MSYKTNYEQVINELSQTQDSLNELPKETLFIRKDGRTGKWYADDGNTKRFISKSQRPYAEKLALTTYLSLKQERLTEEKEALETLLGTPERESQLLDPGSPYRELLLPQLHTQNTLGEAWANMDFESCPYNPEMLKIPTLSKYFVRSKSEAVIANELFSAGIPFRYECSLSLSQKFYYPDFTILRPCDGRELYWEHFGLVDNTEYRERMLTKLQVYMENEIYPGSTLIMTFESEQKPLDLETVRYTMKLNLL